jgi:outer membrane protein OmpA-like peptidoglycan-associated protein
MAGTSIGPLPARPPATAPAAPMIAPAAARPAATTMPGTRISPLPAPPPATAPPPPVIAPVVLVGPPHPEPPPSPPHVTDGAPGTATSIPGGLRVTFGATGAALNPVTLAALRRIAAEAAHAHVPSVAVDAYAANDPSDPSTPRRLSLSRALAARAVLREAGIPSEQIYVRALIADAAASAPANRVDVMLGTPPKGSP